MARVLLPALRPVRYAWIALAGAAGAVARYAVAYRPRGTDHEDER